MNTQPWTISALTAQHSLDLAACQSSLERSCVIGFHRQDLRKAAENTKRPLTDNERATLAAWCIEVYILNEA